MPESSASSAREQASDGARQVPVARHRPYGELAFHPLGRELARHQGRSEIEDPPAARGAGSRLAVVDLARVDHDHVAGRGLDQADGAPRAVGPRGDHPDAELIVRVAREGVIREEGHRLDAGDRRAMLLDPMDPFGHVPLVTG
jgi:hypothetical protein